MTIGFFLKHSPPQRQSLYLHQPWELPIALDVKSINFSGSYKVSDKEIREVLPIKIGDEFSFQSLDMSVTYLRKWGVFENINVRPKITDEGVVLDFDLDQATIIASIDFSGNYPFLEDKIRKYLSIHAGNAYTPGILQDQIDRIKTFYKRHGFADAKVYVDEEFVPDMDGVALNLPHTSWSFAALSQH